MKTTTIKFKIDLKNNIWLEIYQVNKYGGSDHVLLTEKEIIKTIKKWIKTNELKKTITDEQDRLP